MVSVIDYFHLTSHRVSLSPSVQRPSKDSEFVVRKDRSPSSSEYKIMIGSLDQHSSTYQQSRITGSKPMPSYPYPVPSQAIHDHEGNISLCTLCGVANVQSRARSNMNSGKA